MLVHWDDLSIIHHDLQAISYTIGIANGAKGLNLQTPLEIHPFRDETNQGMQIDSSNVEKLKVIAKTGN